MRERLGGLAGLAHLRDHVEPLGARALAVDAHGGRVADSGKVVHGLLDVRRGEVLAAHDDHVLEPSGDEEIAVGVDEAEVARPKPAVRPQDLRRRPRVVVVALHDAGALHPDLALTVGREGAAVVGRGSGSVTNA